MTLVDFHHVELPPPPLTQHVHIQTDGDYTERVVTPFGTTRLKRKFRNLPYQGGCRDAQESNQMGSTRTKTSVQAHKCFDCVGHRPTVWWVWYSSDKNTPSENLRKFPDLNQCAPLSLCSTSTPSVPVTDIKSVWDCKHRIKEIHPRHDAFTEWETSIRLKTTSMSVLNVLFRWLLGVTNNFFHSVFEGQIHWLTPVTIKLSSCTRSVWAVQLRAAQFALSHQVTGNVQLLTWQKRKQTKQENINFSFDAADTK